MIATVSRAVGARGETARRRDARKRRSGSKAVRALASGPMAPNEEVVEFFKRAEAVAFDVDSTVCEDEGIDELAEFAGAGEAVAAITKQAMEGGMPFGEALQLRLEAMKVSRQQVEEYVRTHPPKYSPGIKELMAALKASGKEVYLVSGGFRQMIAPIAEGLGISSDHIEANSLVFEEDGSFRGYDPREFPSIAGGKADAVQHIKATKGYETMVMIGDGVTDLEAKRPGGADIVIGYGGAQRRPRVEAEADWYVLDLLVLARALGH